MKPNNSSDASQSEPQDGSIAEIFPQRLLPVTDKEGQESWSISHRTIAGSRSHRTKKSNVLNTRMREENEKFTEEQAVDSDDMDSLNEVVKRGVAYIEQNSQKVRDAIDVLVEVAKTSMKDNEEYKIVQEQLNACIEEELEVEEKIIKDVRKELKKFKAKVQLEMGE